MEMVGAEPEGGYPALQDPFESMSIERVTFGSPDSSREMPWLPWIQESLEPIALGSWWWVEVLEALPAYGTFVVRTPM